VRITDAKQLYTPLGMEEEGLARYGDYIRKIAQIYYNEASDHVYQLCFNLKTSLYIDAPSSSSKRGWHQRETKEAKRYEVFF